jgi:hypothetical protein
VGLLNPFEYGGWVSVELLLFYALFAKGTKTTGQGSTPVPYQIQPFAQRRLD